MESGENVWTLSIGQCPTNEGALESPLEDTLVIHQGFKPEDTLNVYISIRETLNLP